MLDIFNNKSNGSTYCDLNKIKRHIKFLSQTFNDDVFVSVLSIEPFCKFKDIYNLSLKEPRILPFISADFTIPESERLAKLEKYAPYSYGLKIHTIIQNVEFDSIELRNVIELYSKFNKPIIFHSGCCDYSYLTNKVYYDEKKSNALKALQLVKSFPSVKFIMAHAGLIEKDYWAQNFKGIENIYADTSFEYDYELKKTKENYSIFKILYGSDFPFDRSKSSIKDIVNAFDSNELKQVFSENALKLLNVSEKDLLLRCKKSHSEFVKKRIN